MAGQINVGASAGDGTGDPLRTIFQNVNQTKLESYNLRFYGAKGDGVTNDTAAITAWIAAAPVGSGGGGILYAPRGDYQHDNIIVGKRVRIIGDGPPSEAQGNLSPTVFTKRATTTGIGFQITEHAVHMEGLTFRGLVGNTGDGISIESNYVTLRNISVYGMGQDGIRAGAGGSNVNCWRLDNVICRNNGRYGFNGDDGAGGINANVGVAIALECSNNGSDGIFLDNCFGHTFINPLVSSNTGTGVHIGATAHLHCFIGGDFNEGNGGAQDILIDAGANQNHFFGAQTTRARVTDNGFTTTFLGTQYFRLPYLSMRRKATAEATLVAGVDVSDGSIFQTTLTAARLVGAPGSPFDGQRITFTLVQDGTGGRAVTWNAVFKKSWSDTGNTLNTRSSISFIYDGTNWNQDGAQTPYV